MPPSPRSTVGFPLRENRRGLPEDLTRAPQLATFPFEHRQPLSLLAGQAGPAAPAALDPSHPSPRALRPAPGPRLERADSGPLRRIVPDLLGHLSQFRPT